jgi:ubiquinone/menaquinone biosynthesis C-methylase UbiE
MTVLQCLKCKGQLNVAAERCVCAQCGAGWPVTDGIPRFFEVPTYYWGEVGRQEAQELLAAAREGSWAEAIRARFPAGHGMTFGVLDLQRASWATMLGLDDRSVALDVGSGYGAITHSLSRLVGEVYSIEAIPERIEFTQERLRQERIRNVTLVQASATDLPLPENTFDLVVTNGVLEWVGEWDLAGDPRSAQLRFLNSLCRLIKDDGVLVVGIENRIGYGLFLGHNDHSGIPYTSLVPRRMASFMLRHSDAPHHRTTLNPKREYRTYTYSERGYRKLLTDAGFADVSGYWADPGYNQPYHLIPLSRPLWVREHFQDLLDHPGPAPRKSWRRRLKKAMASSHLLSLTVPEFVLFASKRAGRMAGVQAWAQDRFVKTDEEHDHRAKHNQPMPWALHTWPFRAKSVVRFGDPASRRDFAYVKVHIAAESSVGAKTEVLNRDRVRATLQASSRGLVDVPQTYGTLCVGDATYQMESAARGTHLSQIVRRPDYFADAARVESDFSRLFLGLTELTIAMQEVSGTPALNPHWRDVPEEFENLSALCAALDKARYFRNSSTSSCSAWAQHGDLSIENISIDQATGHFTVFDWADMSEGFSPLYDFFELLYSTGYLSPENETAGFANEAERWTASFRAVFLSDVGLGRIAQQLILQVCDRMKIPPESIPALLVEYLLVRTHYYRAKSARQRQIHLQLLQLCIEQDCLVFGRFHTLPA